MKKCFAFLLVVMLILPSAGLLCYAEAADETEVIANVNHAMQYICDHELITIRPALLSTAKNEIGQVYLIALRGSDFTWDKNDLNRTQNVFKSMLSLETDYLNTVKQEAVKEIPEGAFVVLIGHSLGGMIAQQFAADKEMKARFHILNTLTMGAPCVITLFREGELHRMADSGDAVPFLSPAPAACAFFEGLSYERCGYFGNPGGAHVDSYLTGEVWAEYDCFGVKGGSSQLVLL